MLEIHQLSAGYGRINVLHDIDLHVARGEIVCLLGANGAGKSTLLRTVSGLLAPRSGQVLLEGRPATGQPASELVRHGLVHVPEGKQLFGSLSVLNNLKLGAYVRYGQGSDARKQIEEDIAYITTVFPRLGERLAQRASTLSGGEQQMLAIGRGLMARPRLLLLDELSLGLAPRIVREIMAVVRGLRERGITILLVEQNVRAALDVSDRGYVLQNGRIVFAGPASDLAGNDLVTTSYLGRRSPESSG